MNLKMMLLATTASLGIGSAAAAFDQSLIDTIAAELAGQGYSHMEVKIGPNGAKIEATGPNGEIERLYDNAGNLLKEERDDNSGGQSGSTGSDDTAGSVSSDDNGDDLYDDSDDDSEDDSIGGDDKIGRAHV